MYDGTTALGHVSESSGEHAEKVVETANLRVEVIRLAAGESLRWQRMPVSDRVFTVTEGRGTSHRAHTNDEVRDEISVGDVVAFRRMRWHRIVAAPDSGLTGTLVTSPPAQIEFRR